MELVSQLLERNIEIFRDQKLLACGFFADDYILSIASITKKTTIWLTDYNQFCSFANRLNLSYSSREITIGSSLSTSDNKITLLFAEKLSTTESNFTVGLLLISKTKAENIWYLHHLLKLTAVEGITYTAGANDAGIRSMETVLKPFGRVIKEDNARKCLLLSLRKDVSLINSSSKKIEEFSYYDFSINGITLKIAAMAGVFSADRLDKGTELLLEYLSTPDNLPLRNSSKQSLLDVGCGAGVICCFLKHLYPNISINACDISAFALASTIESAKINNIAINVFASSMLQNAQTYDYIVSKPPFHSGIKQLLGPTLELIETAPNHLRKKAEFYVIANAFLPYEESLLHAFHNVNIVSANNKFKVYHTLNN